MKTKILSAVTMTAIVAVCGCGGKKADVQAESVPSHMADVGNADAAEAVVDTAAGSLETDVDAVSSGGGGLKSGEDDFVHREERTFSISSEQGKIIGGRSSMSVIRIVGMNMAHLRYDYNKMRRDKPDLQGKVNVNFKINESGKVIFVEIAESTMNDSEFENAMAERIKGWNFYKSDKPGDTTEVTYPFVFSPPGK